MDYPTGQSIAALNERVRQLEGLVESLRREFRAKVDKMAKELTEMFEASLRVPTPPR